MLYVNIKWSNNRSIKEKEVQKWNEIMKKIAGVENYKDLNCNSFLLINNSLQFSGYSVSAKSCSSYGVTIDLWRLNKRESEVIDIFSFAMNVNKADNTWIPFSEFETIMNNYLRGYSKDERWEGELIRKYGTQSA